MQRIGLPNPGLIEPRPIDIRRRDLKGVAVPTPGGMSERARSRAAGMPLLPVLSPSLEPVWVLSRICPSMVRRKSRASDSRREGRGMAGFIETDRGTVYPWLPLALRSSGPPDGDALRGHFRPSG